MWVGNVPSNVSHEELWRFFNTTVPTTSTTPPASSEPWRGPSSIFLISRSSCAFVNFSSQADLDRAVPFFNGLSLRPWDPRCPRMVCRVRRKDDDLRAGVGAQRGVGMHRSWIEQHRLSDRQAQMAVSPKNSLLEPPDGDHSNHDSSSAHKSSASFASTNSSFLAHHFPKRYFILKSLTTSDLEECVKTGLWKTQRHNQPILDQAFRTSQEVILIFGANRSGEFYGYAKMEAGDSADPLAPPFRLQWLKVGPLSFSRTRHLRNPWNGDREVKVSRDGTEVEPGKSFFRHCFFSANTGRCWRAALGGVGQTGYTCEWGWRQERRRRRNDQQQRQDSFVNNPHPHICSSLFRSFISLLSLCTYTHDTYVHGLHTHAYAYAGLLDTRVGSLMLNAMTRATEQCSFWLRVPRMRAITKPERGTAQLGPASQAAAAAHPRRPVAGPTSTTAAVGPTRPTPTHRTPLSHRPTYTHTTHIHPHRAHGHPPTMSSNNNVPQELVSKLKDLGISDRSARFALAVSVCCDAAVTIKGRWAADA
ncbi:hypothetical protein VHUM_00485 [Vanrija humicola]|uniref:YTH domain-containing protein n=1 Tax=Vanrija humicola TaxID=5417 RepID=A0A7D8Z7E5_VANHU|nr:hypothetical protein VHUM_00485 [Vanrija humicola]